MSEVPISIDAEMYVGDPIVKPAPNDDVIGRRIAEMRKQRSERAHMDQSHLKQKLSLPEHLKDPRLTYRWVNDKATRIMEMEAQGWQKVDNEALAADARNSGLGTVVERVVNERTTTTAEKGFLMWKPKEFYEEDKHREQRKLDELEGALKRGEVRDPQGLSGPKAYVPAGGISIKHGRED